MTSTVDVPPRKTGITTSSGSFRGAQPQPVDWLPDQPPVAVAAARDARDRLTTQLLQAVRDADDAHRQVRTTEQQQAQWRVTALADDVEWVTPDPDPVQQVRQRAEQARQLVTDLAAARDVAEDRLVHAVRASADDWSEQVGKRVSRARRNYAAAVTALTLAADELQNALAGDAWVQSWRDGHPQAREPHVYPDPRQMLQQVEDWASQVSARGAARETMFVSQVGRSVAS